SLPMTIIGISANQPRSVESRSKAVRAPMLTSASTNTPSGRNCSAISPTLSAPGSASMTVASLSSARFKRVASSLSPEMRRTRFIPSPHQSMADNMVFERFYIEQVLAEARVIALALAGKFRHIACFHWRDEARCGDDDEFLPLTRVLRSLEEGADDGQVAHTGNPVFDIAGRAIHEARQHEALAIAKFNRGAG